MPKYSKILRSSLFLAVSLSAISIATPAQAEECLLDTNDDGVADALDSDGGASSDGTDETLACGVNAEASGANSTAAGANATASGPNAVAFGNSSTAGLDSVAIGAGADATNDGVAIGRNAEAAVIGENIAVGKNAKALGGTDTAIGVETTANGASSIAIGFRANTSDLRTVAIGSNAEANGADAVALGHLQNLRRFTVQLSAPRPTHRQVNRSLLDHVRSQTGRARFQLVPQETNAKSPMSRQVRKIRMP